MAKGGLKIQALEEAVKKEPPNETLFVDKANSMTGTYVQRGLFKKGEKSSLGRIWR